MPVAETPDGRARGVPVRGGRMHYPKPAANRHAASNTAAPGTGVGAVQ